MVVERDTYERAVQIEAQMAERGLASVQGSTRRFGILRAAGLPIILGPRPVRPDVVENNIYTFIEAALVLRHPDLCWHMREAILKRGADRKAPWKMEARRATWAAVLTALALRRSTQPSVDVWGWCRDGRCDEYLAELI